MFNVGSPELFVILLVALIVLGPNKLPEVARQVGKAMGEIRRLSAGFQAELRDAMEEAIPSKPPETTTTVLPVESAVDPASPPAVIDATVTLDTSVTPEAPVPVEPTAPEPVVSEPAQPESPGEVPPS
jgi:sec-independent protein translocase protein TatB